MDQRNEVVGVCSSGIKLVIKLKVPIWVHYSKVYLSGGKLTRVYSSGGMFVTVPKNFDHFHIS